MNPDSRLDTNMLHGKGGGNAGNSEMRSRLCPTVAKQPQDGWQDDGKQPPQQVQPCHTGRPLWASSKHMDCDPTTAPVEKGTNLLCLSLQTSALTVPSTHALHSHRLDSTLAGMSSSTASIVTFSHSGGHLAKAAKADGTGNPDPMDAGAGTKGSHSPFSTLNSLQLLQHPDFSLFRATTESEPLIQLHGKRCKHIPREREEINEHFTGSMESDLESNVKGDKERQKAQAGLEDQDTRARLCTLTRYFEDASQKIPSEKPFPERNANLYSQNVEGSILETRKTEAHSGEWCTLRSSSTYCHLDDFVEKPRSPEMTRIMNVASLLAVWAMIKSS